MEPLEPGLRRSRCALTLAALPCVVALALGGCSSIDPIRFADGSPGYQASCPGFGDNYAACYEEALLTCGPAGFDLVTRDGATSYSKMLDQGYSAQGAEYRLLYGSVHFRSIYLRCHGDVLIGSA